MKNTVINNFSYLLLVFSFSIFSLFAKPSQSVSSLYSINVKTIDGEEINLSAYKGKVMLIVNVASKCGYTKQYKELEALYRKYRDKGLVVLGFPCNQFGGQEPGTNEEIKKFCTSNFSVSFPMFEKIEVNGENTHPLYKLLKDEKPGFIGTKSIKWNFTKFLVDKKGNVIDRFASQTNPESLTYDIEKLLKQ